MTWYFITSNFQKDTVTHCVVETSKYRIMLNTYSAREQVYDVSIKVNESRAAYWIDCALDICVKHKNKSISGHGFSLYNLSIILCVYMHVHVYNLFIFIFSLFLNVFHFSFLLVFIFFLLLSLL